MAGQLEQLKELAIRLGLERKGYKPDLMTQVGVRYVREHETRDTSPIGHMSTILYLFSLGPDAYLVHGELRIGGIGKIPYLNNGRVRTHGGGVFDGKGKPIDGRAYAQAGATPSNFDAKRFMRESNGFFF